MSVILGLNAHHPDSSACLLIDGRLHGAVAEERLGARNKHTSEFPVEAIRWLLDSSGIRLTDVTHVAVAKSPQSNLLQKAQHVLRSPLKAQKSLINFFQKNTKSTATINQIGCLLGLENTNSKFQICNVEHHIAHIASSYYVSPFDSLTAGFSYDGSGDFVSALAAKCEGQRITPLKKVFLPNSLGHFYTAMCQFIGFDLFGEEYKVMGLAPYGEDAFAEDFSKLIASRPDGLFELNRTHFDVSEALSQSERNLDGAIKLPPIYSKNLTDILGAPRVRGTKISQKEMNIARSTQARFEVVAEKFLTSLGSNVPLRQMVLAGGCALNGVMNARIYRNLPVDDMYIQPAASDDGTAIGAAFYCWHNHLDQSERFEMDHSFWGPEYSEAAIKLAMRNAGLNPQVAHDQFHAAKVAANMIANGAVVGWYQGRSEWGPRALGNRSILANPAIKNMKEIINKKIKKRESFRPFAPSVIEEDISRYFEQDIRSPFMMHVVKFKPEWREVFPAVVHVDGSGRLRSVDKKSNALYHYLITCLKEHTGHGIVLNTSFNENEPVVDTPSQAISCYLRTDMDALIIGRFILCKPCFEYKLYS